MVYVDGFVLAVPKANLNAYKALATGAGEAWMEHGALTYVECIGEDVPEGKVTSFPMAVKAEPDEVIVFSWITYPSRAARDETMKKVMADPRMQFDKDNMPFDGMRMIFGGFETVISMSAE
ncbi:MAG: RNA signal recognition particle [Rhizobiales bacterium 17-65-6]|nr:MAG: RNA signal recognition particle [Rhizobiales bacterium 17-65-6]